jgi:hypothetical protein
MIHPLIKLRNFLHNRSKKSLFGKLIWEFFINRDIKSIQLICATRMSEEKFWKSSALGQSLASFEPDPKLKTKIYYSNICGLSEIYNKHIDNNSNADILIFVHDDIWLDDKEWLDKVIKGIKEYDILGVAGNIRFGPFQPAWLFRAIVNNEFVWDTGYLSGSVGHGKNPKGKPENYGPHPVECKVLDGVFMAARSSSLRLAKVNFDEQFRFHFYDLDFCRSAGNAGLRMGTWPIAITHQSGGAFGTSPWQEAYAKYIEKWSGN